MRSIEKLIKPDDSMEEEEEEEGESARLLIVRGIDINFYIQPARVE